MLIILTHPLIFFQDLGQKKGAKVIICIIFYNHQISNIEKAIRFLANQKHFYIIINKELRWNFPRTSFLNGNINLAEYNLQKVQDKNPIIIIVYISLLYIANILKIL